MTTRALLLSIAGTDALVTAVRRFSDVDRILALMHPFNTQADHAKRAQEHTCLQCWHQAAGDPCTDCHPRPHPVSQQENTKIAVTKLLYMVPKVSGQ
jgi:hypothetical protein